MSVCALVAAALFLTAAAPTMARSDWAPVVRHATPAVYAIEVAHHTPLNLVAGYPSWLGTGFQLRLPSGRVEELTACHMVCVDAGATWRTWGQIFVAQLGTAGMLHFGAFGTGTTAMYPNADVAESTFVPQKFVARLDLYLWGHDPAVPGYLGLGDYRSLRRGAPLLVLGNRSGRWDAHGYRPFAQVGTYLGIVAKVAESSDIPQFPSTVLPDTLAIRGNFRPGDSGAPVIDSAGRVVGVFVALNRAAGIGYAVPLEPKTGLPVAGTRVRSRRSTWW